MWIIQQQLLNYMYMWELTFFEHVENTNMTTSFHYEGRIRSRKLVFNPASFYRSACTKPGKWAVLCYLCVKGIVVYLCVRGIVVYLCVKGIIVNLCVRRYRFRSFLLLFYWMLKLFWQCGIFCFSLYFLSNLLTRSVTDEGYSTLN